VKSFECCVKAFVVSGESSEASGPGEAALDNLSARQRDEAALGHGVLDHFEPDAVALGGCCGSLARVALVDIGRFDLVAGHLLHLRGQRLDLRAVAGRPGSRCGRAYRPRCGPWSPCGAWLRRRQHGLHSRAWTAAVRLSITAVG
jgi:hypothetical protein